MKSILMIFMLFSVIFSKNQSKLKDAVDYIKFVDDSIELKVNMDLYRSISYVDVSSDVYDNPEEIDRNIFLKGEVRRYFNSISRITLKFTQNNQAIDDPALVDYDIRPNPNYINSIFFKYIESDAYKLLMEGFREKSKRIFYCVNTYFGDFKNTNTVWPNASKSQNINKQLLLSHAVYKEGFIYIIKPKNGYDWNEIVRLRKLSKDIGVLFFEDDNSIIIELPKIKEKVLPRGL